MQRLLIWIPVYLKDKLSNLILLIYTLTKYNYKTETEQSQ